MMTKAEYTKAVRRATRVFAYIQVTETRRQAVRLSKVKAVGLVGQVPGGGQVNAEWADDDERYLLVG